MRIGILSAVRRSPEEKEKRTRILSKMVAGSAKLDIIPSDSPLEQLQTLDDHKIATPYMVEAAKREEGRYGAYIIGCLGDAGLQELRRSTRTPIIPPSRSAYMMAATLFDRFAILVNNEEGVELRKTVLQEMGIDQCLARMVVTDMAPLDYVHKPDQAMERLKNLLKDGADGALAIIPTCASLVMLLEERGIHNMAGMRVLNPLCVSIRLAETICGS
ncbi:MAG: hypothetical protein JRG73_18015 [Deltaproteobacteria bacterium]|nr:hypothetical protein [Deltaproteobacteria bacterium]